MRASEKLVALGDCLILATSFSIELGMSRIYGVIFDTIVNERRAAPSSGAESGHVIASKPARKGSRILRAKREPKTERMEVRVPPMVKKAIQRATAVSGLAVGDLVCLGARSVLDDHERMVWRGADHAAFLRALQKPSRPNRKLVNALRRHKKPVEK